MRRFLRLVTLMITGIWMSGVLHCNLEAAGVIPPEAPHQSATGCCQNASPCTHDGCEKVEGGGVKLWHESIKVAAPELQACVCLICLATFSAERESRFEPIAEHFERPLDWVVSWHFVRRAAPPARAPSHLS